jgi:hypothetical protein
MLRCCLTIGILFSVTTANAAVVTAGTYRFLDHPDGNISHMGSYGLRLDDLLNPIGVGPTFSVNQNGANVLLNWDGGDSATIVGQIWNNTTNDLWMVSHTLNNITVTSTGFLADTGVMTLSDPVNNIIYSYQSKSNGTAGFLALGDNHRCSGHVDCGPLVARGWLMPHGDDGQYNDWLVQLNPVPLPAAFWLFASALIGLLGFRQNLSVSNI